MTAYNLTGKVAIVTGGQRGIGLGIATLLAEAGAHVVIAGIVDDDGEQAAAALQRQGLKASYHHMDTSSADEVSSVAREIRDRLGRIDILVPNAAIYPNTPIAFITAAEWDSVMAVNLRGPFLAAQAC